MNGPGNRRQRRLPDTRKRVGDCVTRSPTLFVSDPAVQAADAD